jgi:hypothetical protein
LGTQDKDNHYEHIDVRDQRDNKQWTTLGTQDEDNHHCLLSIWALTSICPLLVVPLVFSNVYMFIMIVFVLCTQCCPLFVVNTKGTTNNGHIDVRAQRDNKQWTTLGTQDKDNHYEHIDVREYQRNN